VRVRNPSPDDSADSADDFSDGPEAIADEPDDDASMDEDAFIDDGFRDEDESERYGRYVLLAPDGSLTFRVRSGVITGKFAVAAGFALVALFEGFGPPFVIGVVAAVGIAIYALRDVIGRSRLRADREGLRIATGFGGHRRLAWSEVERLRVDERNRLGTRSELLEIDAGEHLYLLSRFDLGVPPAEALAMIRAIRAS
jgi:Bacterial PH domain